MRVIKKAQLLFVLAALLLVVASAARAADKAVKKAKPEIDPAFCHQMVAYQEPAGVEYQPGVDAEGNPVVEPDLNPSPIKMPDTISFGLTVDTAQYLGIHAPAGLEGKMMIGTVALQDGHVTFNGQPVEGQAEATLRSLCAEEAAVQPEKHEKLINQSKQLETTTP